MCLAIPLKLIEVTGNTGIAERDGTLIEVDLSLVPEAQIGDELVVHVGIALSILNKSEDS